MKELKDDEVQNLRLKIKNLEEEVDFLRSKLDGKLSEKEPTNETIEFHPEIHQTSTADVANQSIDVSDLGFPTATDALASEAEFLENIGLTLNPRWSRGGPPNRERATSDCIEAPELMLWCDQNSQEIAESPLKSRYPNSLLHFHNKTKTSLENESSEAPSTSARWRLWNPEQENQLAPDDLWADIVFSSAAEYIADEEANDSARLEEIENSIGQVDDQNNVKEVEDPNLFCQPCNRSLSSKEAFYRHTLSELHFKRTSMLGNEENKSEQPERSTQIVPDTILTSEEPQPEIVDQPRSKIIFSDNKCPTCHSNVPEGYMGKHMV